MSTVTLGLLLALVSTLATAFAHAPLKAGRDKLAVQAWVRLIGVVMMVPMALLVGRPPASLVGWIVGGAILHAVYQATLIWSYSVSDFSVAYPLARGSTPLLTAVLGIGLLGDRPGAWMIGAVAIVSIGCLVLVRRGGVTATGLVAAGATALLTTAYTLVDAKGVRLAPAPLVFIAWFYLADGIAMPMLLIARDGRRALRALVREGRTGSAAGALSLLAFFPALYAFALAPVGAVAALRECSILVGLVLARRMLDERLDRHRLIGATLILIGGLAIVGQSF